MLKGASETLNLFIRPLKNNDFKEDAGRKNRVIRHCYIVTSTTLESNKSLYGFDLQGVISIYIHV